jgi:hypothetical protein
MSQIPAQIITIDYLLDPDREDIILNGGELKEGMVVLIEDVHCRSYTGTPLENLDVGDRHHYLTCARWCRVKKLSTEGNMIRFVGVYVDGSKCVRSYNRDYAWIIKLPSAPE